MRLHRTILAGAAMLLATASQAADSTPVAKMYDGQITGVEHELVPLVEAMPADKFGFKPTAGAFGNVRTFASQAKHIGAVIYIVSAAALGEKVPVQMDGEDGPSSAVSKADVVKFVKDAFTYAHKAALALTPASETEMVKSPFGNSQVARGYCVNLVIAHTFDHYGQMVVYARMNNIVPPASR